MRKQSKWWQARNCQRSNGWQAEEWMAFCSIQRGRFHLLFSTLGAAVRLQAVKVRTSSAVDVDSSCHSGARYRHV
jgi:hypothetical protein